MQGACMTHLEAEGDQLQQLDLLQLAWRCSMQQLTGKVSHPRNLDCNRPAADGSLSAGIAGGVDIGGAAVGAAVGGNNVTVDGIHGSIL